jgi:hypothetical protein
MTLSAADFVPDAGGELKRYIVGGEIRVVARRDRIHSSPRMTGVDE